MSTTIKETLTTTQGTCSQKFAKIVLRPSSQLSTENLYEISLFVDTKWFEDVLESIKENKTFISLNHFNLRVRHAPSKGSQLKLFEEDPIQIDHNADNLGIDINASILVTKELFWPNDSENPGGLVAEIVSGSIILKNLNNTFVEGTDWKWLDSSESNNSILLLGASKVQLKVPQTAQKLKLFEYLGVSKRSKNNTEYIWKLTQCKYEDLYSPEDILKELQDEIIDYAKKLDNGKAIQISRIGNPAQGIYKSVKISKKASEPERKIENSELLVPGIKVEIFQEQIDNNYSEPLIWEPKALKVDLVGNENVFTLLDYDEIQLILDSQKPPQELEGSFTVLWENSNNERKIDFNYSEDSQNPLVERTPHLYLSQTTQNEAVQNNYIWSLAKITDSDEEYSWMRYRLNEYATSNRMKESNTKITKPTENFSGRPLKFYNFSRKKGVDLESRPWLILIDLFEDLNTHLSNRLQITFSSHGAKLLIANPQILAKSPEMTFYSDELKDPSSLHSQKLWKDKIKQASFIFVNEPNPANLALGKGAIKLYYDHLKLSNNESNSAEINEPKKIYFVSQDMQTVLYQTSHLAGIDRVSASSNNLPTSYVPGMAVDLFEGNATAKFILQENLQVTLAGFTLQKEVKYTSCFLDLLHENQKDRFLAIIDISKDQTLTIGQIVQNDFGKFQNGEQKEIPLSKIEVRLPKIVSPRDPGHGLVKRKLNIFELDYLENLETVVKVTESNPLPHYSTEALMPWVERKFTEARDSTTDEYKLYHRNLVLEHGEFELAREYADLGQAKSTYNASEAFIQATRDRYCLAADLKANSKLFNWLPALKYTHQNQPIQSKLSYMSEDEKGFPEVQIEWEGSSNDLTQNLGIHIKDSNWLDYFVKFSSAPTPTLEIIKTKESPEEGYFQTVNSYTPLLFDQKKHYDNLGVIRDPETKKENNGWVTEKLEMVDDGMLKSFYSVSTCKTILYDENNENPNGSFTDLSQIIVTFDEFKVNKDGSIPHSSNRNFHNYKFNLGSFGFFSNVKSYPNSPFEALNHWPRYKGIPFYVTEITSLNVHEETMEPESMTFKAVLANPEELMNHQSRENLPNFIYHALTNNKLVSMNYVFDSLNPTLTITEGSVDWIFSTTRQLLQSETNNGIAGRLGRFVATVHDNSSDVRLRIDIGDSKALALGKLWNINEQQVELKNSSLFFKDQESNYLQVQYGFYSNYLSKIWYQNSFSSGVVFDPENHLITVETNETLEEAFLCRVGDDANSPLLHIKSFKKIDEGYQFHIEEDFTASSSITLYVYDIESASLPTKTIKESYIGSAEPNGNHSLKLLDLEKVYEDFSDYLGAICQIEGTSPKFHLIKKVSKVEEDDIVYCVIELDSAWQQVQEPIEIKIIEHPFLRISTKENALNFHLPIDLSFNSPANERQIEALISTSAKLKLYFSKDTERLLKFKPRIIQSYFYCLSLNNIYTGSNEGSLIAWIENRVQTSLTFPYYLAGQLIENIELDSPLANFYLKGSSQPLTQKSTIGIDVHYQDLNETNKRYIQMSTVLEGPSFTLRFEDQDFSKVHSLKSDSDEKGTLTAFLEFSEETRVGRNEIGVSKYQGPVQITFQCIADKIIISSKLAYYSKQAITEIHQDQPITTVDIIDPLPDDSSQYILHEVKPKTDQYGTEIIDFLSVKCDGSGFTLERLSKEHIPLNFCLDPNVFSNITKLRKSLPSLSQRLMFGKVLRRDIKKMYDPERQNEIKIKPNSETHEESNSEREATNYLISPLANDENDQLFLMKDNIFLKPSNLDKQEALLESILVFNRPTKDNLTLLPYYSISSHSTRLEENEEVVIFENEEVQKKVLEKGANGIILKRKFQTNQKPHYQFISSPFHAVEGEEHVSDLKVKRLYLDLKRFSITSREIEEQKPEIQVLDFRSLAPRDIMRIDSLEKQNSYKTIKNEKAKVSCCNIEREVTYQYQGAMHEDYLLDQPSLYLFETPAYQNMEPLWYLPPSAQHESHTHKTALIEPNAYFLPYNLQINYGPDKPGAAFHHELRNIVHSIEAENEFSKCRVGYNVDFSIRDPQQIKVNGCISAEINNLQVQISPENPALFTKKITASWKDVFGNILLEDLFDAFNEEKLILPSDDEAKKLFKCQLKKTSNEVPLKLFYQHNYDVEEVKDLDGAIPAYIDEKRLFKWWSNLYIASKIESLAVNDTVTFEIEDAEDPTKTQNINLDFAPYLSISKFEKVISTNNVNQITIEVEKPSSLEWINSSSFKPKIFIPCLQVQQNISREPNDPLPAFEVEKVDYSDPNKTATFTLKNVTKIFNQEAFLPQFCHLLIPLETSEENIFMEKVTSSAENHLWKLNLKSIPLNHLTKLQIMWLGTSALMIKPPELDATQVYQMGSIELYPIQKVVKMLMPALTSPKIAAVLHLKDSTGNHPTYKKTIFFGNSAPPESAIPTIENNRFILYAPDNDFVEVNFPSQLYDENSYDANIYLIKYMVRGQVVYTSWNSKTSEENNDRK